MEELIKLLIDWNSEVAITEEDIKHWLHKYVKGGEITLDKKVELANAIIEEAAFNDIDIDLSMEIEHQLGTVWIGNTYIQPQETEE